MKSIQIKQGDLTIANRYDSNLYSASGVYEFTGDMYLYAVNKTNGAVASFLNDVVSEVGAMPSNGVSEEVHLATIRILTGREKT